VQAFSENIFHCIVDFIRKFHRHSDLQLENIFHFGRQNGQNPLKNSKFSSQI